MNELMEVFKAMSMEAGATGVGFAFLKNGFVRSLAGPSADTPWTDGLPTSAAWRTELEVIIDATDIDEDTEMVERNCEDSTAAFGELHRPMNWGHSRNILRSLTAEGTDCHGIAIRALPWIHMNAQGRHSSTEDVRREL